MKRALIPIILCLFVWSASGATQTRRRSPQRRPSSSTSFAQKQQAEIAAGREQIAAQIKILTQFLYLFGGIWKGIETAEQVNRNHESSSVGMSAERIKQNKIKLNDSIRNVRTGLERLEATFRLNPVLQAYYSKVAGIAKLAQTAEGQAAANNFDESGRSLTGVANKLVDALVALH